MIRHHFRKYSLLESVRVINVTLFSCESCIPKIVFIVKNDNFQKFQKSFTTTWFKHSISSTDWSESMSPKPYSKSIPEYIANVLVKIGLLPIRTQADWLSNHINVSALITDTDHLVQTWKNENNLNCCNFEDENIDFQHWQELGRLMSGDCPKSAN